MWHLREIEGKEPGRRIALSGAVTFGRTRENDVPLNDDAVSRRHTQVRWRDGRAFVSDLGSRNGTVVNGATIAAETELFSGDELAIGRTRFRVEAGGEDFAATEVLDDEALDEREVVTALRSTAQPGRSTFLSPPDGLQVADYRERLRAVLALEGSVIGVLDLERLLERLLPALRAFLPYERAYVEARDPDGARLVQRRFEAGIDTPRFTPPRSIPRFVQRKRQGVLVEEISEDRRFRRKQSLVEDRVKSALSAPLVFENALLGFIYLDIVFGAHRFAEHELDLLSWVADRVAAAVHVAAQLGAQRRELSRRRGEDDDRFTIIGAAPVMVELCRTLDRAANSDATALIVGATGTGKELAARRLHRRGSRRDRPFVALNCAAVPGSLIESELFGHEAGAFTGAAHARAGLFEEAHQGLLFLDEVGELPPASQAKLLRVLQEGEFHRLGATRPTKVDVRIVAATNRDLAQAVREGRFREDLWYRLKVIEVMLPPLRDRPGDIALLTAHFLSQLGKAMGRTAPRFDDEARVLLERYSWPGNVRQLRNVIERALIQSEGLVIPAAALPQELRGGETPTLSQALTERPLSLREAEALTIQRALDHTGWKKGEAAAILGTSWPTLNKKIDDYGLAPPHERSPKGV